MSHFLCIKGHSFELISLDDNFLNKDMILIILLFELIKLDYNITIFKGKYKKIKIQFNLEFKQGKQIQKNWNPIQTHITRNSNRKINTNSNQFKHISEEIQTRI